MKIKILTFVLSLFFFTLNLISQNSTFEYLLSTPMDETFREIVETTDGSIYFSCCLSNIEHPYYKTSLIVKLDNNGVLIDSNILTYPNKSVFVYRLLPIDSNNFVVVASVFDKTGWYTKSGILFYNMDKDLVLTNQTLYSFDSVNSLIDIYAYLKPDNNLMTSIALHILPQVPRLLIYEFNNNFDSLRAKYYPDEAGMITSFKALQNGNYWMFNMNLTKYMLFDSALNIIDEQGIPDWLTGNQSVVWDTDTSFYLLGKAVYPGPPHNLGFIKQFQPMDTTGHIYNHWNISDTADFPAFWGGIDFKNKDSIFIGGTRNMWGSYYNRWPSWFIVLQTDSLLNIRWERFYGGDAYYMMGKLIATNDGGCLVAGTRYDYLNTTDLETDIIILKLNNEGLITSNPGKPSIEMHEAIIYPNPGTNVINVRIAVQYKQSVFELFDINGRHILKENFEGTLGTVNTTFLKQGTYIYRITSDDGLFETGKWVKQ